MQPFGHSRARVPEIRGGGFILVPATEIDKTTRKLTHSTSREYGVVLTPEAEGPGSASPTPRLPRLNEPGRTREEALSMIHEAIEAYIESLVAHGDPIPGPVEFERVTVVAA